MAFEHYITVRNSDLYEYRGLTKSVLMTIAMLIRDEPEEDERGKIKGDRHPNTGWCDAGEEYLAAALGASTATISNHVTTIKADGWLEVETWRNSLGHLHNKYRFANGKLDEIKARAHKKDEGGNLVRGKEETKARKGPRGDKGRFLSAKSREASQLGSRWLPAGTGESSLRIAEEPNGKLQTGATANCSRPHGKLRQVVGLSGCGEQVVEHVDKKQADSPNGSKNNTNTKINDNTKSLSGREFASLLGAEEVPPVDKPRGVAPNPTEASRLETPGTLCVPPNGGPPVTPPPSPKLPEAHYSHKRRTIAEGTRKEFVSCKFCGCVFGSIAAGRLCRPDSELKEEAYLWRLAEEARLEAGVRLPSDDATSVSF